MRAKYDLIYIKFMNIKKQNISRKIKDKLIMIVRVITEHTY